MAWQLPHHESALQNLPNGGYRSAPVPGFQQTPHFTMLQGTQHERAERGLKEAPTKFCHPKLLLSRSIDCVLDEIHSARSITSTKDSPNTLVGPCQNPQFRGDSSRVLSPLYDTVVRVGLKYGFRYSELISMSSGLERRGFKTRKSLGQLTVLIGDQLGIPEKLVQAIHEDLAGAPQWRRTGAVKMLPASYCQGPLIVPDPYDSRIKPVVMGSNNESQAYSEHGGFPTRLRSYSPPRPASRSPRSSLVGIASPRVSRAVEAHMARQAPRHREREIQAVNPWSPWLASSANHRPIVAVIPQGSWKPNMELCSRFACLRNF